MNCFRICSALLHDLGDESHVTSLHSSFESAANLVSPFGLITLLRPWKCLQPSAVIVEPDFDFELLRAEGQKISRKGLFSESGRKLLSFEAASEIDLQLKRNLPPAAAQVKKMKEFLNDRMGTGLVEMAFGKYTSIFAEFLKPRLEGFREAVRNGNMEEAVKSAWQLAGCGPGLTPSSDDWLCGYLIYMPGCKTGTMAKEIAKAAAARTNDISAALLCNAGKGYFSEDVLNLLDCMGSEPEDKRLDTALKKVADFGSSSGCDFLTGMYFGILDFYEGGGIRIEKIGNSQECLL